MSSNLTPGAVTASSTKPLWVVVGVLGVAVLGMGGTLLSIKSHQAEPTAAVSAAAQSPVPPIAAASAAPAAVTEQKSAATLAEPASAAAKKVAKLAPKSPAAAPVAVAAASQSPVAAAVQAPAQKPICGNCGTVDGVTPVERQGKANGVGAVAGGVAGALLGHEVGSGGGKTLATVLGGVAGGLAGNAIEKKVRKEIVYSVHVAMEDGSSRTLELPTAPPMGAKVTVDGNILHGSDGSVLGGPPPAKPRPAPTANDSVNRNPG